jgi:hypothetical protein
MLFVRLPLALSRARLGDTVAQTARVGSSACWAAQLEIRRKSLRSVMHREDVNLVLAHEPIDDSVGSMNNLTNQRAIEFRNGPTGLRKCEQPIRRRNQLSHDDRCVVRGVLTDEGANSSEVGTGLMGPENNSHSKNCFLTSSWDTS